MNERHSESQEKYLDASNTPERPPGGYSKSKMEHRPLRAPPAAFFPRDRSAHKSKPAPIGAHESARLQQESEDVEKGPPSIRSVRTQHSQKPPYQNTSTSHTDEEYDEEHDEEGDDNSRYEPKRHAVWILVELPIRKQSFLSICNSLIDNNRSTCLAWLPCLPFQ